MKLIQLLATAITIFSLSFMSCSENSCDNTMCENGGVCIDGTCDCPEGFTGPSCREQATPDKIRITGVEITRFPGFKHDAQWDGEDGPDIFFRLYEGQQPLAQPMLLWENADPALDYNFFINIIDMRSVTETHRMQLLDYDGIDIPDDFMGEIEFVPYNSLNGFPETITLDDGGPIAFNIKLEYLYNKDYR